MIDRVISDSHYSGARYRARYNEAVYKGNNCQDSAITGKDYMASTTVASLHDHIVK